jgi:hypothetical protein
VLCLFCVWRWSRTPVGASLFFAFSSFSAEEWPLLTPRRLFEICLSFDESVTKDLRPATSVMAGLNRMIFFDNSCSAALIIEITGHRNRCKNKFTYSVHFQAVDKQYVFIVF